ncbi:MAG: bifunctional phosphoribosylaminoimidazolecarboxamide formyltransferase/IMP cyclohydrolase [Bacillota bacterium]|nr:bifunctional phosphoribosylaminoimidazolecarboxamide formyltransferase/IMP cyclohydrolase [Bacillota bacterium]
MTGKQETGVGRYPAGLALLSVSDKRGLVDFARRLVGAGFGLVSSGGTAGVLREAGLEVRDVSELTGFPECLGGRVKTLHPVIHAGILARRQLAEDLDFLETQGIDQINLVAVNLYPFAATVARPEAGFADCVEQIDIGGPSLLRAAAKNHESVLVLSDPDDYERVASAIETNSVTPELRRELAARVYRHTADYDRQIADFFVTDPRAAVAAAQAPAAELFPERIQRSWQRRQLLRYGENPQQLAAWYVDSEPEAASLAAATQIHGKELSYNNIADADAALDMVLAFRQPAVVAVKHQNPCGIAERDNIQAAWEACYESDPVSIFGGIVALNRPVTAEVARQMHAIFLEVIIAPAYEPEALAILERKKNLRLLAVPGIENPPQRGLLMRSVRSGLLLQEEDEGQDETDGWKTVTKLPADEEILADARFGMQVVRFVKSNGIVVVHNRATLGIGPGQTNRVGAVEIALRQAGEKARGAVLASDAFFPFDDSVRLAAQAGIRAIVQPGGSVRDEDSIRTADELGLVMLFSGRRHFRH